MMTGNSELFRKVTIIGVGLIGGSIGMAIKKNRLAKEVVGLSRRHGPLVSALKSKAIDKISHDLRKAVNGADLVILATPVKTIVNLLPKIARYLKRGCIITDAGSTKTEIVAAAHKILPSTVNFVGSHPLAGSERKGVIYAHADLFRDSTCIITPTDKTNRNAKEKIEKFWTSIGSVVKVLAPIEHDQVLAYTSHVPHILAYGLMQSIPEGHLEFASRGFKDTTRIAASDPNVWSHICMANSKNILQALDELVKNLSVLRKNIASRNEQGLIEYFKESKKRRDDLS